MKQRSQSEIRLMSAAVDARDKLRFAVLDMTSLGAEIQNNPEALRLARRAYRQTMNALNALRAGLKQRLQERTR